MKRTETIFSDIKEKLDRFISIKLGDPVNSRYGKHDGPMTGAFRSFRHAHLRDDAILIYTLKGRALNLIYVAAHAEIEGKRCRRTFEKLKDYN